MSKNGEHNMAQIKSSDLGIAQGKAYRLKTCSATLGLITIPRKLVCVTVAWLRQRSGCDMRAVTSADESWGQRRRYYGTAEEGAPVETTVRRQRVGRLVARA